MINNLDLKKILLNNKNRKRAMYAKLLYGKMVFRLKMAIFMAIINLKINSL
jgi:hypothetical protein